MTREIIRRSRVSEESRRPRHSGKFYFEAVPLDTKSAFKAACARNERTMRDVLIELMRGYAKRTFTIPLRKRVPLDEE